MSEVRAMIDGMPRDDALSAPLVGRDTELAALLSVVDINRNAIAALVSGDAGVGKTRLLREFADRARTDGYLVLVGHCLHFGGDSVPYLPISEAFGRLARDEPEVVDQLRAQYPPISRLLPQRRIIGAPAEVSGPLEPADLLEAIFGSLVALGEHCPVVLILEDVHWADGATRDLVGFLLTRVSTERVGVVASYRTDDLHRRHPLRPLALEWGRLPAVVKVPLAPLGDESMRTLVRQHHEGPLSEDAVARILDRAGGNAFFAEQLLAEMDGSQRMPADLAELLLMRLDRLSTAARSVVRAAAVSGRQVGHQLIAAVSEISDGELDAALREAVDAHVLDRSGADTFLFRHALLAEAVYDDLLPGERVRLHRAFANALADGRVRGTDADLARHAREAMDLETAFSATVRAGDEAMRVAAPNDAMRHYESAIAMADRIGASGADQGRLALKAGAAAAAAGHQFRALQLVREAYERLPTAAPLGDHNPGRAVGTSAEPGGPGSGSADGPVPNPRLDPQLDPDLDLRVELLIAIATWAVQLDTGEDYFSASALAVSIVPADPPTPLRARALAAHALSAAEIGRDDDASQWATEARGLAIGFGLPGVAADAATTLGRLHDRSANPEAAVQLIRSSIEQATTARNLGAEVRGLHSLGALYYDGGDLPMAVSSFTAAMTRSREGGWPWVLHGLDARVLLAQTYYVTGEWDAALELGSVEGETPPPLAGAGLAAVRLGVLAGRGQLIGDGALRALRPWWRRDGMIALLSSAAHIDAASAVNFQEHYGAALELHDEVVTLIADIWQNRWFQARIRLHGLALGVLAAAAGTAVDGDRAELVARGRVLIEQVHTVATKGLERRPVQGPEGRAWVRRADAEWARLRWRAGIDTPPAGELVKAWTDATEAFGYGHAYEEARSRTRLAAALQATGDSASAQSQADRARAVARRLEAEPLLAELKQLALRPARVPKPESVTLTGREHQVLEELTQGRTNRQIAKALFISDKTVSVHVSNILAKLGAAGRTEAAAIARRDGLLDR
ncbi:MAG: transcriptional regulator, LuxR family [Pseudonocardiales bacterium]|nr:transcriptional regulator, LuxR family [Pseudonocardiales bacterium]